MAVTHPDPATFMEVPVSVRDFLLPMATRTDKLIPPEDRSQSPVLDLLPVDSQATLEEDPFLTMVDLPFPAILVIILAILKDLDPVSPVDFTPNPTQLGGRFPVTRDRFQVARDRFPINRQAMEIVTMTEKL